MLLFEVVAIAVAVIFMGAVAMDVLAVQGVIVVIAVMVGVVVVVVVVVAVTTHLRIANSTACMTKTQHMHNASSL